MCPAESLSYDRAAAYYNDSNLINPETEKKLIEQLIDILEKEAFTKILDVGAGTGRMMRPLMEKMYQVTGIDLSFLMLQESQKSLSDAVLVQGDATALPFPAARFDAVIVSHVLHLVANWKHAIREIRRVLCQHGVLLHHWSKASPNAIREQLKAAWVEINDAKGINVRRPGVQDRQDIVDWLTVLGANLETTRIIQDQRKITPRCALDVYAKRLWSDTWTIPDAEFVDSFAQLSAWAQRKWPDLNMPIFATYDYYWQTFRWGG
jgi:SAM-dependent methyltransferase